ncbi:MAG TPA: OmpA family protein [Pyrinomonadaceae bacterium]|jgi:outer membrane protein OmpA-like peptidoglycan-associated protein
MSGRDDDDGGTNFDLTTPFMSPPGSRRPGQPPAPQGGDFDRTAYNIPREGGNRTPPRSNAPRNNFDLTSVNFNVPYEDEEDNFRRPPVPQQQAYVQRPPQQTPVAPVAPATSRRVPTWVWVMGGSFLATLFLIILAGLLYFFWPFSSTFTLRVLNAPQGSKVFVDEVPIGVSQASGAIIAQGLRAGEMREVRVTHEGYADWRTTVKGEGGEVREIRVRLTPLTAEPPPAAQDQIEDDLGQMGRARIYGANFDPDSDRLKEDSKPTLDRIVAILKKRPDWRLTIEGHTDSTSTPEHNKSLSERRAVAMKNYLQASGIDPSRLTTVGYGASKPVAGNETPVGRAMNRRVELVKQ